VVPALSPQPVVRLAAPSRRGVLCWTDQHGHPLRKRLARFGLSLHPDKTRLIEFGRFAASNRAERGLGKPETFDFLGFTHCCSQDRQGRFKLKRTTVKKRMRVTLRSIRETLMRRRHQPTAVTGRWLNRVVNGYYNYYAVPTNIDRLAGFRSEACRAWRPYPEERFFASRP
jgi:hypothetical protein